MASGKWVMLAVSDMALLRVCTSVPTTGVSTARCWWKGNVLGCPSAEQRFVQISEAELGVPVSAADDIDLLRLELQLANTAKREGAKAVFRSIRGISQT